MDFSPHGVNHLKPSHLSPSALSPVDVLYLDDGDRHHYGHGDVVLFASDDESVVSPSMVSQTIDPSQLADCSPSPSRSPTPYYTSPCSPASSATSYSGEEPPAPKSRRGRKTNSLKEHDHVHANEPYPSGSEPRLKRHQTKRACISCRKLNKRCDDQRPCGRCVQFNRCSECVDAPPRKARAKGVDRGTYKKRDTATPEFQESAFVAKSKVRKSVKGGGGAGSPEYCMGTGFLGSDRVVNVKLEDVGMDLNPLSLPMSGGIVSTATAARTDQGSLAPVVGSVASALSLQGGSLPFTGPLEDLFTCSASPEMDGLTISSPSIFDESSSYPSSPEPESDLPLDTPATSDLLVDDYDLLVYHALDYHPNIMKLLNDYADAARQSSFDPDEFERLSDIALKA